MNVRRAAPALAALALLLLAAAPARAGERIRGFRVDIALDRDGSFVVEERIDYDFGDARRHGIFRDIPVRYGRGRAADYRIGLDVLAVTDAGGRELPYELSSRGRNRRIRIGDPDRTLTGRHEYRIRYRVRRGILWFEEHDELYWNATGTEWPVPIERADASVRLPDGASATQVACFTGRSGSVRSECRAEQEGALVVFVSDRPFAAEEGLTLVLGVPKGVLDEPSDLAKLLDRASDYWSWIYLLPLGALGFMGVWWWRFGRDAAGPQAVPVRYEPPDGLTPGEVGTVLDETAHMRDVTSTILDLAVRGYVEIEEVEGTRLLFLSDLDYRLRERIAPDDRLKAHERRLLAALFPGGEKEKLVSELRNKFYKSLPGIQEALYREVSKDGGYFPTAPDRVRQRYVLYGAACVGLGGLVGLMLFGSARVAGALAASGVIVGGFGTQMPRRTRKGRRAYQHIRGFREFLERVEVDRLERLGMRTAGQFEKILPYAFVLGAVDEWAEAFADLYTEPPDWYRGSDHGRFRMRRFVSDLDRSLQTCGASMQSRPNRGSGSSGFSGGSSGGGFGGGGGGSW